MDDPAPSLTAVAAAHDRARPAYPREAAEWLTGTSPLRVLELGAGTGKLTDRLLELGHDVLATDPVEEMLQHLGARHPRCRTAVAPAEQIPAPSRSVDVVVSGQAVQCLHLPRALPEIARVLEPQGVLALAWNIRDERIPWVARLGRLVGSSDAEDDPTDALVASRLFGFVEERTFRSWQPMRKDDLRDLALSRSNVAALPQVEQEQILEQVDSLYDDYGRGPDGLLLPYVTRCLRAVLRPFVLDESDRSDPGDPGDLSDDGGDDGTPLISLR